MKKNIKSKKTRLEVTYPSKCWPDWDTKIERLVGTDCDDSGMGFGKRELGFTVPVTEKAKIIEKLKISGLEGLDAL